MQFTKASLIIHQIAKSKSNGDGVQPLVGDRQIESIRLEQRSLKSFMRRLRSSCDQHRVAEVGPEHRSGCDLLKSQQYIAGSAAQVEYPCARLLQNRS